MSKVQGLKKVIQDSISYIQDLNPYVLEREDDGIKLKKIDKSFDPTRERDTGKVFLILIDGQDTTPIEVDKHGDDMVLEYEDKYCAITSKPLLIDGNQFYFSRDGFLGTMALNKDTLLAGDLYQQSLENRERKISKDIDFTKLPYDIEKLKIDETDDYYVVDNSDIGDVATLHGSKKTLKEVNKAKRLRKLLQPSKMDKKQILMAIGSGIAVGLYLYPHIQG